jgi:hypothetical protein
VAEVDVEIITARALVRWRLLPVWRPTTLRVRLYEAHGVAAHFDGKAGACGKTRADAVKISTRKPPPA